MLQNNGPLGPRDFHSPRVSGISCCRRLEDAERAAGQLEQRRGCIFGLDCMHSGGLACLHSNHISQQPQNQVECVNSLIDYGAAAI